MRRTSEEKWFTLLSPRLFAKGEYNAKKGKVRKEGEETTKSRVKRRRDEQRQVKRKSRQLNCASGQMKETRKGEERRDKLACF